MSAASRRRLSLGVERGFDFARVAAAAQDETAPAPKLESGGARRDDGAEGLANPSPRSTEASRFPPCAGHLRRLTAPRLGKTLIFVRLGSTKVNQSRRRRRIFFCRRERVRCFYRPAVEIGAWRQGRLAERNIMSASCRVTRVLSATLQAMIRDRRSVCAYRPRKVVAVAGLMLVVTEFCFSLGGGSPGTPPPNHGSFCRANPHIRPKATASAWRLRIALGVSTSKDFFARPGCGEKRLQS